MEKKIKRITFVIIIISMIILFFSYALNMRHKYEKIYNEGVSMLEDGDYTEAINCFNRIPDYIDYRDISELLDKYDVPVCPHCGALLE